MAGKNTEVAVQQSNTQIVEIKDNTKPLANPYSSTANFQEMFDMAKMLASSDVIPAQYQGKPMNCLVAIETANRTGLSADVVMEQLNIIKGKKSWSGEGCQMIVQAHPKFSKVKLNWIGEPNTDSWGAYVTAYNKELGEIIKGPTVTVQMAKDDGWYGRNPKWKSMTELMLTYRAYAFFARTNCASALNGYMTTEEYEDIGNKGREVDNPFEDVEVVADGN